MKKEKNIDSIIRDKLDGFSSPPPLYIWNNVQRQLLAKKRKNRRLYIAWISAAAVVMLAFLAGWYVNENSKIEKNSIATNKIIQSEKNETVTGNQQAEVASQNAVEQIPTNNSKDERIIETSTFVAFAPDTQKASFDKPEITIYSSASREMVNMTKLERLKAQIESRKPLKPVLARNSKPVLVKTLTEQEKRLIAANIENIKIASKPEKNWRMGMYIAPGYSSYTSSHTESYSQNMTYSGSDGNANVSGGFSVQYKTRKRWIVESGVYYAQNGQQSENPVKLFAKNQQADNMFAPGGETYFSNAVRVENNNLEMNSTAGVIQFKGTPKGAELSGDFEASSKGVANLIVPNGNFSQVFDFMEVPLYLRYRVVDSRFGVELITGLNAGIVVGNNAFIENQYGLQNIGETQDISPVNLSGTFGVGVNYALGKHFSVAVEPRFNYYLNSINTNPSVDFRPYRIGFYTGLTYGF